MKYSDQKDNRSRRRPGPQTPLLLPLLLLCLGVTLWGANGGCVMTPGGDEIQSGGGPPTDAIARAVQLLQQGDGATAMGSIQQIVRDMGDTSMAASAVADELTRRSRPDAAVQLLQSWKEKHADALWDPMLWMSLSQAQLSAGDKDAAATTEKEGATRASEIMKEIGRYNPATSPLVPTPTRDAVIKLLQAAAFYSASDAAFDFAKTRMALEEAYRLTPKDPVIINQLGYTLADKGSTKAEYDRAAELTQQAVALAPGSGMIMDSYGWALFKKGDLPGARRILREAADAAPDIPEIRYHLGVVYAGLDMKKEALLEYERALRIRPDFGPAQAERARLLQLPGVNPL